VDKDRNLPAVPNALQFTGVFQALILGMAGNRVTYYTVTWH